MPPPSEKNATTLEMTTTESNQFQGSRMNGKNRFANRLTQSSAAKIQVKAASMSPNSFNVSIPVSSVGTS